MNFGLGVFCEDEARGKNNPIKSDLIISKIKNLSKRVDWKGDWGEERGVRIDVR